MKLLRKLWRRIPIGTRSVLIGAHCFCLHPWFVAEAWRRLYGFPWDPRLWVAFWVHDLGYVGKGNMDGSEGELHPYFGASLMGALFDKHYFSTNSFDGCKWYNFTLLHSRYLAKAIGKPFSRLCVADKLAIVITPAWLYLPMVRLTGELEEYLENARNADSGRFSARDYSNDVNGWHRELKRYMLAWIEEHREGKQDTWTSARHTAA